MPQDKKEQLYRQIEICTERDVLVAAAVGAAMARQVGFSTVDCACIETTISELARNQVVHAGGGMLELTVLTEGPFVGMRVQAVDSGKGIQDVNTALQDGYSTKETLGIGLGVAKRMMDDFSIRSCPGWGTQIVAVKWKR